MTFKFTEAYRQDWKLRQRFRVSNRPSNAKNHCIDCGIEAYKNAKRCPGCATRNSPSRRKA